MQISSCITKHRTKVSRSHDPSLQECWTTIPTIDINSLLLESRYDVGRGETFGSTGCRLWRCFNLLRVVFNIDEAIWWWYWWYGSIGDVLAKTFPTKTGSARQHPATVAAKKCFFLAGCSGGLLAALAGVVDYSNTLGTGNNRFWTGQVRTTKNSGLLCVCWPLLMCRLAGGGVYSRSCQWIEVVYWCSGSFHDLSHLRQTWFNRIAEQSSWTERWKEMVVQDGWTKTQSKMVE